MHTRAFGLIPALLLAAGLALAGPARADDNVAIVNGQPLTQAQFLAEVQARYGFVVREALIINLVIEQEAKKKGFSATEAEIDTSYNEQKTSMEQQTGQSFDKWLVTQQLTVAAYRQRLRNNLLLQKMVAADVTAEQVKALYQRMPPQPEALHLTWIYMNNKEEADKVRDDLVQGRLNWAEAAEKHNLDPKALDAQGKHVPSDQGWVAKTDLKDEILTNLQRDGDLTPVMEYQGTWAIVRREGFRPAGQLPFEEVEGALRIQLVIEAAQRRFTSLMDLADIKKFGDFKQPGT
jgi:parvulin-like peptidyl-prolyl isomerase